MLYEYNDFVCSKFLCTIAENFNFLVHGMSTHAHYDSLQAPPNMPHPFAYILLMTESDMATLSCPNLEDLLAHYDLQRKDLESVCPQEVRDRIALKLEDWKMVGRCFKFPPEKLTAIHRENETEEQRRVALLDEWGKREGKGATYLKLAEVLHQRGRSDLVEMLCDELRKSIVPQKHTISRPMESKQFCVTKISETAQLQLSIQWRELKH